MPNEYIITLSDGEKKALEYVALDANNWIQNAIHERCRLAIEELVSDDINDKLSKGLPIVGTKEEMLLNSTLPSAAERHEATIAQMADMLNNMPTP